MAGIFGHGPYQAMASVENREVGLHTNFSKQETFSRTGKLDSDVLLGP